ncbi:MAG: DDE-type integrase/transposase/recombinase [Candidatus Thiodiazotropha sp. (ex Rostrolucina anterorostrata)]|nr:DDE-type integrase/transposase/recombinase [Candidatus Thiodiazotropha sp. (ex Rostrolucina anterorostrata)]
MSKSDNPYYRHRFPPEVISHAIWLCHRFTLSFRDIEEMLAVRGVQTSYESVRRWCLKFPRTFTESLRKRQGKLGDIWYLDEVFITVNGKRHYLWRAVDQDGAVIDILMQSRRNRGGWRYVSLENCLKARHLCHGKSSPTNFEATKQPCVKSHRLYPI